MDNEVMDLFSDFFVWFGFRVESEFSRLMLITSKDSKKMLKIDMIVN